jgi:hypothetical protein
MIIRGIDDYSITVTLDILQAGALMQMLHLGLSMGLDEDVALNMCQLGTEIESHSVVLQLGQVIDSMGLALGMEPYCEDCMGDKSEEPDYEADADAPKPPKETVH